MILEGYFGGKATFQPRLSHAAFGGGGLPNLKGGDCLGKPPPKRLEVFGGPRMICFCMTFRSIPKPIAINNKSKSEAKAIPREARARAAEQLGKVISKSGENVSQIH